MIEILLPAATSGITLPSPELGNTLTYKNTHNLQRAMSGDLYIYRKKPIQEIRWEFKGVNRSRIKLLEAYLSTNRGKTFKIKDWNLNEFKAKLLGAFSSTDSIRGQCEVNDDVITLNTTSSDFTLLFEVIPE